MSFNRARLLYWPQYRSARKVLSARVSLISRYETPDGATPTGRGSPAHAVNAVSATATERTARVMVVSGARASTGPHATRAMGRRSVGSATGYVPAGLP